MMEYGGLQGQIAKNFTVSRAVIGLQLQINLGSGKFAREILL